MPQTISLSIPVAGKPRALSCCLTSLSDIPAGQAAAAALPAVPLPLAAVQRSTRPAASPAAAAAATFRASRQESISAAAVRLLLRCSRQPCAPCTIELNPAAVWLRLAPVPLSSRAGVRLLQLWSSPPGAQPFFLVALGAIRVLHRLTLSQRPCGSQGRRALNSSCAAADRAGLHVQDLRMIERKAPRFSIVCS